MPKYKITDNKTGKTLIVSGDSPPTGDTVDEIFSQHYKNNPIQSSDNNVQQIQSVTQQPQQSNVETAIKQPFQTIVKRTGLESVPVIGDVARGVARAIDLPAGAVGNAAYAGGRNLNRGIYNLRAGNYETGAEQLATVPINLLGGAFSVTPQGALFNTAVGAAQEIPVVRDIVNSVLSPTQTAFNPQTEEGQARSGLVDAIIQTALLSKSGEIGRGVRELPRNIVETAKNYKEAYKNSPSAFSGAYDAPMRDFYNKQPQSIEKANSIVGQITQGDLKDIPKTKQALTGLVNSGVNVTGIKTFDDLNKTINGKIEELSSNLDNILSKKTDAKKLSDLNLTTKVGEKSVSHNFVDDAINQLKDFYEKTNNQEGIAKISEIEDKANNNGLTVKDINDISRLHGKDLSAYNQNGELASGLKKQSAENTRIGVKETARKEFGNHVYEKADKEISNLIRTRDLVSDLKEKSNEIKQKTKELGWGERAGKLAYEIANGSTFGLLNGVFHDFLKHDPSTLNAVSLEKGLNKRLLKLKELTSGTVSEESAIRSMEKILRDSGKNPNNVKQIPVEENIQKLNNESDNNGGIPLEEKPINPISPQTGSAYDLPKGIDEATKNLPPLEAQELTREQKRALVDHGYSVKEVSEMNPEDAIKLLGEEKSKATSKISESVEQPITAIKLSNGEIVQDVNAKTHAKLVDSKNINPSDIVDGGFILNGEFKSTGSAKSLSEMAKAKEAVEQSRKMNQQSKNNLLEDYSPKTPLRTEKQKLEKLKGETTDQAIERKVGYQIDNGKVTLEQTKDGWKATVADWESPKTFRAFKKQHVLNQVYEFLNPEYGIEHTPVDKKSIAQTGSKQAKTNIGENDTPLFESSKQKVDNQSDAFSRDNIGKQKMKEKLASEMTRDEYVQSQIKGRDAREVSENGTVEELMRSHHNMVERIVKKYGVKRINKDVLKDYPDIIKKYSTSNKEMKK